MSSYSSSSIAFLFFLMIYSSTALSNVFDTGKYTTTVKSGSSSSPPLSLLIGTPNEAGEFSTLLLLPGFLLRNSYYSQLIEQIASHGYIVIAPQLGFNITSLDLFDATGDIRATAEVTNWLSEGLSKNLPEGVRPNLKKLAIAGHSRGGKVAFGVALKKAGITIDLEFKALIGVDPIDGESEGQHTNPQILTGSLDFDIPVLVTGSGLGPVVKIRTACAPTGVNHVDFYSESKAPAAWHFVATHYGVPDILNDRLGLGELLASVCEQGQSREPMRKFVGGVIVAFLNASLHGDNRDLLAIRDGQEQAPVKFTSDAHLPKDTTANYFSII